MRLDPMMPHDPQPFDAPADAVSRVLGSPLEGCGPVTFPYDPQLGAAADAWKASAFVALIAPAFLAAHAAALAGRAADATDADERLDGGLDARLAESSRHAGRRMAAGIAPLRGDRVLKRVCSAVEAGATPGHAAVVFAVRAAVFSVPARRALAAYVGAEIAASGSDPLPAALARFLADCIAAVPAAEFRLHAA